MAAVKKTDTKQDEIVFLEHSFLKAPYEQLNRTYRQSQKILEREVTKDTKPPTSKEDLVALKEQLLAMRSKIESCSEKESASLQRMSGRVHFLKDHADNVRAATPADAGKVEVWEKKREDRMLVDYCFRSGYYKTATMLVHDGNVEDLVDMEIFMEARRIEESLLDRNMMPCLVWCAENKTKLKRIKSNLEFECRQQGFVELIRKECYDAALKYASKHFSNVESHLEDRVTLLMGLLAFGPKTTLKRYESLLSDEEWPRLAGLFRQEAYTSQQMSGNSLLSTVVQTGISAMKCTQCYEAKNKSSECPVCQEPYNELSKHLPFKRVQTSKLICQITGKALTQPMMLPNCQVYDRVGLEKMAAENSQEITCPRTGKKYFSKQMKKVYLM
ncbi:E3 ubiquitin-protein transferase MAEA-like [Sycon ciliatum]|uniref:E3 ubiquitin-protein transferase MAEA-like n=1 Tax=Sycon ciliatum TaxID=27933 RepID=UPI0020A910E9